MLIKLNEVFFEVSTKDRIHSWNKAKSTNWAILSPSKAVWIFSWKHRNAIVHTLARAHINLQIDFNRYSKNFHFFWNGLTRITSSRRVNPEGKQQQKTNFKLSLLDVWEIKSIRCAPSLSKTLKMFRTTSRENRAVDFKPYTNRTIDEN